MTKISPHRIAQIESRFSELEARMASGQLEGEGFVAASREYSELEPVAKAAAEVRRLRKEIDTLQHMVQDSPDPDLHDMAVEELEDVTHQLSDAETALAISLLPRDSADDRPAMLEIRAGTGGDALERIPQHRVAGAALVDRVTARTLLEDAFACGRVGAGEKHGDGRRGDLRCCVCRCGFFCHDGEAFLLRRFRVENAFRSDRHRHQDEDGAEKGTHAHVGIRVHLQSSPCSQPISNRTILKSRGTYVFCITLATRLWSRNWDYLTLLCGDLKGLWT